MLVSGKETKTLRRNTLLMKKKQSFHEHEDSRDLFTINTLNYVTYRKMCIGKSVIIAIIEFR